MFALANPDPEVDPAMAMRHAAVVATGRSDYPNQINNVLAFPGVFRGLLDAQARDITDAMLLAASAAIADVVHRAQPVVHRAERVRPRGGEGGRGRGAGGSARWCARRQSPCRGRWRERRSRERGVRSR